MRAAPHIPILILSLLMQIAPASVSADGDAFVRPAELERDVRFWQRVYTEITTSGGFIHDDERLDVVYEVLQFEEGLSPKQRARRIDEAKRKYAGILNRLAQTGPRSLSVEEQRVLELWPQDMESSEFRSAANRVRFQLGQADRFREGLVRSGTWIEHIAATFERLGLPPELAALPHVESSFNTYAYSKVGAAGMWQFMRGTGRRYLRIDHVVDERLDPYRSTEAAAQLLAQNYAVLGTWPLAITAYNHGTAGMRRAKEVMGTDDITTIVRNYRSRSFGFASRNFYVAFLAALEIDRKPQDFFSDIRRAPVDGSQVVVMPAYVPASSIAAALGTEMEDLKRLNPSLLPSVWNGSRHVPRGFEFRVPGQLDLQAAVNRIPASQRYGSQVPETHHRVASGETLSTIAAHHRVSMTELAQLNGLRRPYLIRVGQRLVLPAGTATAGTAPVVAIAEASAPSSASAPAGAVAAAEYDGRYAVQRGDTVSGIAARFGMGEDELMQLNDLRDRNYIYEGQLLSVSANSGAIAKVAVASQDSAASVLPAPISMAEAEPEPEPATSGEADALGPTLIPGAQAAGTADPGDYTVAADGSIRVEAAETLGHYADWLELRAAELRRLNNMRYGTPLVLGRRLQLDFSRVTPQEFEARRFAYHQTMQESFFAQYRIAGSETHEVRSGESVWVIAQRRYNLPIWLLRQYNPDVDFAAMRPGTRLVIPQVAPVAESASES